MGTEKLILFFLMKLEGIYTRRLPESVHHKDIVGLYFQDKLYAILLDSRRIAIEL